MKSQPKTFKHQAPVAFLIFEVSKLIKRRFEDEAKTQGITLPQWRVLGQLAQAGCDSQSSLAAATDIDPMTLSGVLDRLDKRGLVDRFADPNDSRAKMARLTAEGEALVAVTRRVGLGLYEMAIAGVSEAEQAVMVKALSRMRDNLSGQQAELEEIK